MVASFEYDEDVWRGSSPAVCEQLKPGFWVVRC